MHAESPLFHRHLRFSPSGRASSTTLAPTGAVQPDGALPGGVAATFAATSDAPQLARHAASDALAHWSPERREAALLVISELVTNAIRHGTRRDEDRIAFVVRRRGSATRIEVTDPRARGGTVGDHGVEADLKRSGWGLPIVAELTDRWGVERGLGRTCVWCEIDNS